MGARFEIAGRIDEGDAHRVVTEALLRPLDSALYSGGVLGQAAAGWLSRGRARPCSFIGLDIIRGETLAIASPIRLYRVARVYLHTERHGRHVRARLLYLLVHTVV